MSLRDKVIRVAEQNPEIRPHLLDIIKEGSSGFPEAERYRDRMLTGPLDETDIASHLHLLQANKELFRALQVFHDNLYGDVRMEFERLVQRPMSDFIHTVSVPYASLPEAKPRKGPPKRPPGR